jgi:hypothetical protein
LAWLNVEAREMAAEGDSLTVLWEGTPVGQITVTQVVLSDSGDYLKVEGAWTPAAGFATCQPLLEEKDRLEEAYYDSLDDEGYDRLVAAIQPIAERMRFLPELPGELHDFGIDNDKAWLFVTMPGAKPRERIRAAPKKWKPGDAIPIPSHLAGWVTREDFREKMLHAAVRCPCGNERLEFRYPGITQLVDGRPFPCIAEIGKVWFFLIQAACPDCRREHVLFDNHFHGCDGFLNPESKERALPRPRLWSWRCLECGFNLHMGNLGVVLDYETAYYDYGYADRFGAKHWPDAFGWFSMGFCCCGCGHKTPVWVDFETR